MPQLRVSKEAVKRLKIKEFGQALNLIKVYDDWFLDIRNIQGQPIFILMHLSTKVVTAIPEFEIGGAKNFISFVPVLMHTLCTAEGYYRAAEALYEFFDEKINPYNFVYEDSSRLIESINKFVALLEESLSYRGVIDQQLCTDACSDWLDWVVRKEQYNDLDSLFDHLFNCDRFEQ